jgi:hypothetical protein
MHKDKLLMVTICLDIFQVLKEQSLPKENTIVIRNNILIIFPRFTETRRYLGE